mgnify:CR=1 FL=1
MRCSLATGLIIFFLIGCQSTDDRAALRPIPDTAPPQSYAELLTRARKQTKVATEAFYVDNWIELEDAATSIQQTAKLLPKALDIPAKHKDTLVVTSGQLGLEAVKLAKAARSKNVDEANKSLQQLNLKVRQLRLAP